MESPTTEIDAKSTITTSEYSELDYNENNKENGNPSPLILENLCHSLEGRICLVKMKDGRTCGRSCHKESLCYRHRMDKKPKVPCATEGCSNTVRNGRRCSTCIRKAAKSRKEKESVVAA